MDVMLNEDQLMLQEMTRRFVEARSPIGALRKLVDRGETLDRALWREAAELGWIALLVPVANGGVAEAAQGAIDAAIIAEELGRVVFAGPFLSTSVVAAAVAAAGSDAQRDAWLPGLASGDMLAAWCFAGTAVNDGAAPTGVTACESGSHFTLDGTAGYVEEAEAADLLLVTAIVEGGLSQFLVPAGTEGVSIVPLDALDLGRRLSHVRFDSVSVGPNALLGDAGAAADQVERQLQFALVLQCAETVGVTDRVFEFTLDWVKQRYAFGRPIGSYQALKHRLADHAAQLEAAKAASAHAARSVQTSAADAAIAVSVAKSHCGRQSTEIIRDCLQLHGGIGLTWDHDIHFYLRRAVSNEALWGTPAAHHERLCRLAGL
jgi:alkylation response protein AidB-like acyl-CoA dehydrogenase